MKENNELVLRVHGPGGKRVSRSHEAAILAQVRPYNNSEHDAAFSPTPPLHIALNFQPQASSLNFTFFSRLVPLRVSLQSSTSLALIANSDLWATYSCCNDRNAIITFGNRSRQQLHPSNPTTVIPRFRYASSSCLSVFSCVHPFQCRH